MLRSVAVLLAALVITASALACEPGASTTRVRVSLQPPEGIEVAAVVVSLGYPTEKLVIEGRGAQAGRSAVANTPPGAVTASDDLDGELRQVVAKPSPLAAGPIFDVTLKRCAGSADAAADELTCRVIDASDPMSTKISGARCLVTLL
jgi:hypothetical protein